MILLLVTVPLAVDAQQAGRVYRLGILGNVPSVYWDELIQALRDRGYVEGQNLRVARRYAEGRAERWPELATELINLKVDTIVVNTTPAALAVRRASNTMPVVHATAIDPVGAGLAATIARPGGSVTGIALLFPELTSRGLAMLTEAAPGASLVAVLWNAANPGNAPVWSAIEGVARLRRLRLVSYDVRTPDDFEGAFQRMTQQRPDALLVLNDVITFQQRRRIANFTSQARLPGVSSFKEFAELGGLMSYGPKLTDAFRRAASHVDRILKGANPGDLPFEQPTTFELAINLKTARALGLTLPSSLLAQVDHVIE